MTKSRRWITSASAETSAPEVAQCALQQRLGDVLTYLPLAAKHFDEDLEYVHQLRVATRRSMAGIGIFCDMLPEKRTLKLMKRLKQLRQAAGTARDLDVLGQRMMSPEHRPCERTAKLIRRSRKKAQKPLIAEFARLRKSGFEQLIKQVVKRVRWRADGPEPRFDDFSRAALGPFVDGFFLAAEVDLSDIVALHELRISGKRVRYAMEVFAGAFDPSFRRELYPIFVEVQKKLGDINDHATAGRLFEQWRSTLVEIDKKLSRELGELVEFETRQTAAACAEFRLWWTARRSADLRSRFAPFVQQPESRPPHPVRRARSTDRRSAEVAII